MDIELLALELPGRQRRFSEPLVRDMDKLLTILKHEFLRLPPLPSVFFGHSLGGLLAFELARRLTLHSDQRPDHLFISGTIPPRVSKRELWHTLPHEAFLARIIQLGGMHPALLQERELLNLILPTLRADFALGEAWRSPEGPPLVIPITAFGGIEDPEVTVEDLEGWRQETTGPFRVFTFPGDHFFIHSEKSNLLRVLRDVIEGQEQQ